MEVQIADSFYDSVKWMTSRRKRISDWWYYIRCKFYPRFGKYNTVKINTLEPTFTDKVDVLLHASFELFCEFMEKEDPINHFQWEKKEDEEMAPWEDDNYWRQRKRTKDMMLELYNWWKHERPKREYVEEKLWESLPKPISYLEKVEGRDDVKRWNPKYENDSDAELARHTYQRVNELEEQWWQEDQKNLRRLVSIRGHLWT